MKVRSLSFVVLAALLLSLLLVACGSASEETAGLEPTPQAEVTPEPEATSPPEGGESVAADDVLAEIVVSRTPQPTATPGLITEEVSEFAYKTGLARISFLGLAGDDWINLAISIPSMTAHDNGLDVLNGYS